MINDIREQRISFKSSNKASQPQITKLNASRFKSVQQSDLLTFTGNNSSLDKLESIARKLSVSGGDKLNISGNYVQLTPHEAMSVELLAAIKAIKEIAKAKGKNVNGPVASPIENEKDSSWIKSSTFYNLSPRAIGGLVNSIKLLPTIRPESIYLAPIFENCNGALYAQSSFDLDPDIYKKDLEILNARLPKNQQITADELMQAFVDAAHLLDKKVGMDLIPHVGDWSDFLLERPELFRWVKLNDKKDGVAIGMGINLTNPNDKYIEFNQGRTVQDEIKDAVLKALQNSGNSNLQSFAEKVKDKSGPEIFTELKNNYPDQKNNIKNSVLAEIKQQKGYVNVPVTPWNGTHLPEFAEWMKDGNYPRFQSNNKEPYGNLTPFKFFNNKDTINAEIDEKSPNENAIKFFVEIFPMTREKYGLDFIRADMAKHAVDKNNGDKTDGSAFRAGYATKEIWQRLIERARDDSQPGGHKAVGALAEAFSEDMVPFAKMGFDLTLGNDQYWVPKPNQRRGSNDHWNVEDVHKQNWLENIQDRIQDGVARIKKLTEMAKKGEIPRSISQMFSLDTHDCAVGENKHRAGREDGNNGVALAMTLGLFGSSGPGRRPFYMMNGNEDGSVYASKKGHDLTCSNAAMPLKNDKDMNKRYHALFNAYDAVKDIVNNPEASIPKWHDSTQGSSVFSVKSPAGDMLTVINENSNTSFFTTFTVPGEFSTNNKGLIILDDKNILTKTNDGNEVSKPKRFARVAGKRMVANLPPAGAHVFKVIQPKDDVEWMKIAVDELLSGDQKNSDKAKTIADAMKGKHSFNVAEQSNNSEAAVILETKDNKYLLKLPLDNPWGGNISIETI
ncbi:MAG: hypothetical protein AB1782_10860 [Cyanobacteriota bacterium]